MALLAIAGIAAIVLERMRYRSVAAEQAPAGRFEPGGDGAEAPLEPRFGPTDEVFVDPTSGQRMRVYLDRATGERRYRMEG
jgi:hypothetical protein